MSGLSAAQRYYAEIKAAFAAQAPAGANVERYYVDRNVDKLMAAPKGS
jgi:hypothetical protein